MTEALSSTVCGRIQVPVIGIPIDVGTISQAAKDLIQLSKNIPKFGAYVCVANVHMLTIAKQNPDFEKVLQNAAMVVPDGMPLVWTEKLKGYKYAERICGPDLMLEICKISAQGNTSIYLLGGDHKTLALLSGNLQKLFQSLKIAGLYAPDKLPEKAVIDAAIVAKINSSGANIVFVGLGCPKQEYWCATYAPHVNAILIGVGAAFDFHAGTKKRPPALIQKCGLEWLYRLLSEPQRLWKRYLVTNSLFLYYSAKDFIFN